MAKVKVIFYLPTEDNDGRDLSAEIIAVEDEVFAQFHGFTFLGYVKGAFRMADSSRSQDTNADYSVVLDETRIDDLQRLLLQFKSGTLQEAIYLEIDRNVEVRFI